LSQLDALLRQNGGPMVDRRLQELLGLPLVKEANDSHFAAALGADKRIYFIDLADKVRPAPL
jgi:hypothetical protein